MTGWIDLVVVGAIATGLTIVVLRLTRPLGPGVGDAAPEVRLLDQDGRQVTLSHLRGRWVALSFFPKADTGG